jgi:hypothetical protein
VAGSNKPSDKPAESTARAVPEVEVQAPAPKAAKPTSDDDVVECVVTEFGRVDNCGPGESILLTRKQFESINANGEYLKLV